jgi:predicted metal-binding membrane protein
LTAVVGAGYFFVWAVWGLIIFPLGVALAHLAMQLPALARAMPMTTGVVVVLAGVLQLTSWKAQQLACCSSVPVCQRIRPARAITAWRHGLHLGLHCGYCCAGLTAILLVSGVMDLRTMAVVTAAVHLERLAPAGARIARMIGMLMIGAGWILIARSLAMG